MARNNELVFMLTVPLSSVDANAITMRVEPGETAADKLSRVATSLLRDLAKGGVMLAPEWAGRVQAAIGTVDSETIATHVEKAVGRSGDSTRVEWIVDPTQIGFYMEQAENAGISLNQQLKAHLDYAYQNGWLGSSAPDPFKILLTKDQYKALQNLFAKDVVTGQDVIDRLGEAGALKAVEDTEYDPVLESLTEGGR